MSSNKSQIPAMMNVSKGEEIAGMWISLSITEIGVYKLLAKKRVDKKYEWVHFVQRENGMKDSVYRGEVENIEKLNLVLEIMNNQLSKTFGQHVQMKPAKYDSYVVGGAKGNESIN